MIKIVSIQSLIDNAPYSNQRRPDDIIKRRLYPMLIESYIARGNLPLQTSQNSIGNI